MTQQYIHWGKEENNEDILFTAASRILRAHVYTTSAGFNDLDYRVFLCGYFNWLCNGNSEAHVSYSFRLERPDRVLVHEFVVTKADLERRGVIGSGLERSAAQTQEDLRIGRALAKALAENLVNELRHRGIESFLATEASRPGETTASIRGQFQSTGAGQRGGAGFTLIGNELRTHIQIFQGSELNVPVVAESEYTMSSSLRPGLSPEILAKAVSTDAFRAARPWQIASPITIETRAGSSSGKDGFKEQNGCQRLKNRNSEHCRPG